jgi:hypothetical protein
MSKPDSRIKCRWCDWRTPRFVTGKDGKITNAFSRLRNHIEFAHPAEAEAIYSEHDE